jgi:protein-disulfide isomerase
MTLLRWQSMACFRIVITSASFVFSSMDALGATSGATCKVLGDGQRTRLVDYVKKKYKLPQTASLTVSSESFVSATCFRKVEFKSADSERKFRTVLFVSPDLRFLAPELLDSNVDPLAEERQRLQALEGALTNGNFPSRGPKDARVSITIFSDFQCPYCSQLARMLNQDIFPTEGKTIRVIFRYFPLDMHNWARPAAQATACAQEQGDDYFWHIHDFLFQRQHEFTPDNVVGRITEETKHLKRFDSARFKSCIASNGTAAKIERDIALGNESGVNGTPTLFVNGERVAGVVAPEQLRTLIREAGLNRSNSEAR